MLRNYITVAIRHLFRHKFFSAINIICLAIGICFTLIIGLYVLKQYNVNAGIRHAQNQYIIKSRWKEKDMGLEITTLGPLPKAMREEYPQLVAGYYRYNPVTNVVSAGNRHFKEDIAIGDTSFISMYGFEVIKGDRTKPFADNSSAVITATMAKKLFGEQDPINQTISIQGTIPGDPQVYKVTAVLADIPYNSVTHLLNNIVYSVFVPTEGNRYYGGGDPAQFWNSAYEIGMVELQPGITPQQLAGPVKQLLAKYTSETFQQNLQVELAPLTSYYLNDQNGAARKMALTLGAAALLILFMAVINFININIGTSTYRLKEIGLRKVFGGRKRQLILQFLTEALVLTSVAALLSLGIYQLLRPLFSDVLNTQLPSVINFGAGTWLFLAGLIVTTGLIAGMYPAFVLSAARMIHAVKGKSGSARGGLRLRKAMLCFQFTLAIVIFICAMTVSRQVAYVFAKDKGYNEEQVLVVTAFPKQWDTAGVEKMISIKQVLQQLPAVLQASLSFEIPDRKPPNSIDMQLVNGSGQTILIPAMGADEGYAATFGLHIISGSCFNQSGGFIPNQIVLNESAVRALGLTPATAINRQVRVPSAGNMLTIAGVVKDFNYSSMQERIDPLAFFHVKDATAYRFLSLKLKAGNIPQAMASIRQKWQDLSPNAPFEYTFMDEKFRSLYQSELQLRKAGYIATALNLLIVFLGIFGVVSFTLARRTREIAVRKVLGADSLRIIGLFLKDYAWLFAIANLIAWPVAYIASRNWLSQYAYRIEQNIFMYMLVCAAVFLLAGLLISLQCLRASRVNPAQSLQQE